MEENKSPRQQLGLWKLHFRACPASRWALRANAYPQRADTVPVARNSNTSISSVLTINRTLSLSLLPPFLPATFKQPRSLVLFQLVGWLRSSLILLFPSPHTCFSLSLSLNRFCPSPSPPPSSPSKPRYKADPSFPLSFSPAFFDVMRSSRRLAEDKEEMS